MDANVQPQSEAERGLREDRTPQPLGHPTEGGDVLPLFLRGASDGSKGNAQDEKDEVGE